MQTPGSATSVRLALVGCGGMGQRHVLGYEALLASGLSNIDLVAVCDTDETNARRVAAEVERVAGRAPRIYASTAAALADDGIDAFDVVTDASSHYAVTMPILAAGRHVLCEKPLGLTVRSCRAMVDAAAASGAILATAENYRRDPMNRLVRAVLDAQVLGEVFLMTQQAIGGNDEIIITPWRHLKDKGAIGLDMGAHYTDILRYYLGEIDSVYGRGLIAEPVRRRRAAPELDLESYRARFASIPEQMVATGEDSVIAMYRMASGTTATLAYIPSGAGQHYWERRVHGRSGSLDIPNDRSGKPVELRLATSTLRGHEIASACPDFRLDALTTALFGTLGSPYDLPGAQVDAALLAIELHDFAAAILDDGRPEVDGRDGMLAVASVLAAYESDLAGRSVSMAEVLDSSVSAYQDEIDEPLGLR
jgi:predicted dehydrogenase